MTRTRQSNLPVKVADDDLNSLRTWAEISPSAIRANAGVVRKYCPQSGIIAVLKADAYGHGANAAAAALADIVDFYAVANLTEARALRQMGLRKPTLILSPALPGERTAIAAEGFIPSVSSEEELAAFSDIAEPGSIEINLKIDTGMGRSGILLSKAAELLEAVRSRRGVTLRHISTHLPSADVDEAFTETQLRQFAEFVADQRARFPQTHFHALNSAGILRFGHLAQDLVRPGLMLYGVSPVPELAAELQPACTWKTRICLLRELPANHGISYGRHFITNRATRTALLPVGYADGYPRTLSERGAEVLIRGQRCPVLGIITMDLVIVDVSQLPHVAVGDEVVLLGSQGSETIPATELADKAGTIPWEILTGIQNRVRRVVLP